MGSTPASSSRYIAQRIPTTRRQIEQQAVSGQRVVKLCENPGTVLADGELKLPRATESLDAGRFAFLPNKGGETEAEAS